MTGEQRKSEPPISDRIKEKLRDLADRVVEAIEKAFQPEPQPLPIPVRSPYRRRR